MRQKEGSKYYVFDIETLGTGKDAVVVSAAFLAFDFAELKTFEQYLEETLYVKFDIGEQRKLGRTVDQSTVDFWKNQPPEVQTELLPSKLDRSIEEASAEIIGYLRSKGIVPANKMKTYRFCRGTDFDIPILESLFAAVDKELPGAFWCSRDIRSFLSGMLMDMGTDKVFANDKDYKLLTGFKLHDARHDVAKAALELVIAPRLVVGDVSVSEL